MSVTPARWMNEKAARIVREFSDHVSGQTKGIKKQKADIEKPYYDVLGRACGQLLGEATAFPEAAQALPEELLHALRLAPFGTTISPLERIAIIILDADAREAATILQISGSAREYQAAFIDLKFYALAQLLREGGQE